MAHLTAKRIDRLLRTPGRYGDDDPRGLKLQVTNANNASWLFVYQRQGRTRMMGLGPLRDVSLTQAREKANELRQLLRKGINPLDARKAAKVQQTVAAAKTLTFEEAATAYYDSHKDRWRNAKHKAQFLASLKEYAYPTFGKVDVADIDVTLVLKVLEQKTAIKKGGDETTTFWKARPETANRVRGRIEMVLAWATTRGHRSGDNPARWKGFLATQLPSRNKSFAPVKHLAAMPYGELPAFMAELHCRTAISARALEFTILTAARTEAVIGATWDEIDLAAKVWTVPASRAGTKIDGENVTARRVPLSPVAVTLLEKLPHEAGNPHIFVGTSEDGGLSNNAMLKLLGRMERDVTVHGFRSSFRDWAAECTNYPNHVCEAALWHAVADKVEAAYRRGELFEKRRKLMADWTRFIAAPVVAKGEVVPLRGLR